MAILPRPPTAGNVTTFIYGNDPNNPQNPDLLTEVDYPDGTWLKFTLQHRRPAHCRASIRPGSRSTTLTTPSGRLSKLTDGGGNLIVQYTYDAAGNLIQKDMGNGTRTVYTYDADGQRAVASPTTPPTTARSIPSTIYTYDAVGNV